MTAIVMTPYSVQEFNQIPDLADSEHKLNELKGEEFILSTLQRLLIEHKLTEKLGVQLLHRHFRLEDGEKLVEHNRHSAGWKLDETNRMVGGLVVPTSWRVLGDKRLMPYEFSFLPKGVGKSVELEHHPRFVAAFVEEITVAGLQDTLALTTREANPAGLEITQGRSNIFFPAGTYEYKESDNNVVAGWFFNLKGTSEGIAEIANTACYRPGGHGGTNSGGSSTGGCTGPRVPPKLTDGDDGIVEVTNTACYRPAGHGGTKPGGSSTGGAIGSRVLDQPTDGAEVEQEHKPAVEYTHCVPGPMAGVHYICDDPPKK